MCPFRKFQMDEFFDRPPQERYPTSECVLAQASVYLPEGADCRPLSGGFQNWNFLIRYDRGKFVLRVSKSADVLKKEVRLLDWMNTQQVSFPVPKVLWSRTEGDTAPMAAITFMDGEMLWKCRLRFNDHVRQAVSFQIGAILAKIHNCKYPFFGFLNEDLKVASPIAIESFADWTVGYMRICLASPRFRNRMDQNLRRRLEDCINTHLDFHLAQAEPCFCHGDFNEKNMLLDSRRNNHPNISAVLDWEYALVSTPSVDIGNLFRFSAIDPWINAASFEAGYLGAGGKLCTDWRSRASFVDLVALCHFLDSEDERPITHATARKLIDASLKRLAVENLSNY
jgi:aminoglycoside phosphotransferase (APT) family kinase protein